jgi:hypothetical protein
MNQAIVVEWDSLRSLAFGGIAGAYAPVGTPFNHVARIVIMQNFTDTQLLISFDGVNDNLTLPPGGQLIIDYMSDKSATGGSFAQQEGTQVYAKDNGVAATAGSFYVAVIYGKGE